MNIQPRANRCLIKTDFRYFPSNQSVVVYFRADRFSVMKNFWRNYRDRCVWHHVFTLNHVNFTNLQIFGYQIQLTHFKHLLHAFHRKTKQNMNEWMNETVESDGDTSVSVCALGLVFCVFWSAQLSGFPQETSLCPSAGRELRESRIQRHYGIRPGVHAMVSFPGSLLSLKVCMFITSSVFTIAGGWAFCFRLRWHFRDTLSSSTIALQNDRCINTWQHHILYVTTRHINTIFSLYMWDDLKEQSIYPYQKIIFILN